MSTKDPVQQTGQLGLLHVGIEAGLDLRHVARVQADGHDVVLRVVELAHIDLVRGPPQYRMPVFRVLRDCKVPDLQTGLLDHVCAVALGINVPERDGSAGCCESELRILVGERRDAEGICKCSVYSAGVSGDGQRRIPCVGLREVQGVDGLAVVFLGKPVEVVEGPGFDAGLEVLVDDGLRQVCSR